MSTLKKANSPQEKSPVGLLLIISEIISNYQRDELCLYLHRAFQSIDNNKYHEINDIFNNLIHENEFQIDSQYRQMANTENGSIAGFLYLPNFHTLVNILKDLFNMCYHVCVIFCGQQIDLNGDLILSDSIFTSENFQNLFEENPSYVIEDLEIILPFISNQWKRLGNNYLQKHLQNIQIIDLSNDINDEILFGDLFYDRLYEILNKNTNNFDIYNKLIPRDTSGTIVFEEPNLYILYGQQGQASLFGIRGFVLLVNGGFSQIPSYWNLIRGLQNIDACILTHFDYDAFPGLQTILQRKTIPSLHDGELCKPDIGAIFLNHNQRIKLQSISNTSKSSSNSKLLNNLSENIDQFLNNIKQLHIDTFDLSKNNKSNIEPINLFKKIAFGSLDLYVLHPTASITEDDKLVTSLQKILIRDQQPISSIIPLHHWFSSCSLLVWTPTSKSTKENLVRILYTGACPQTLVFEALNRVRHLEFLHEFQRQPQQTTTTTRINNVKTIPSPSNTNTTIKQSLQKSKVSPPTINRIPTSTIPNKTSPPSRPINPKPKTPITTATKTKSEKPRPAPIPKKTPPLSPSKTNASSRSTSKDKKTQKPSRTASKSSPKSNQVKTSAPKPKPAKLSAPKPKPVKTSTPKAKSQGDQVKIISGQNKQKEKPKTPPELEQKLESSNDHQNESITESKHQEELITENQYQGASIIENGHDLNLDFEKECEQNLEIEVYEDEKLKTNIDDEENLGLENESKEEEELLIENKYEGNLESENDVEQKQETNFDDQIEINEEQQLNTQQNDYEEEQKEEKDELEMSADELNDVDEVITENHEDEIKRPEAISLSNGHDQTLVESITASPIDEIKSQSSPHDPMTSGFIEGASETENPFNEKIEDINDDEMEIIHHEVSTSNDHTIPDEDIHPQGLPIENSIHSGKLTNKKSNNKSNRTNGQSASTNNTNHSSSSGSIFYVDVAYIPYNGNEHYVDSEFFRRIRARYYILNGVQINPLTLESLIDGKQQWENKEHIPVTLVPTFDGEQLRQFFMLNKTRLSELNINILPASIRCNVQYDDEGSPAQRLRFSSIYDTNEQ